MFFFIHRRLRQVFPLYTYFYKREKSSCLANQAYTHLDESVPLSLSQFCHAYVCVCVWQSKIPMRACIYIFHIARGSSAIERSRLVCSNNKGNRWPRKISCSYRRRLRRRRRSSKTQFRMWTRLLLELNAHREKGAKL